MMKSRRNNKKIGKSLIVTEDFRIKTETLLRNFILNENMTTYEFPTTLNNAERAWIHNYIKNFALTSKSHGKEPNRKLIVTKRKGITNKDVTTITLGKESKQLIQAFLCKFPLNKDKIDMNFAQPRYKNSENADTNMGQLTFGIPQLPSFGLNNDLIGFRMSLPIWPMRENIMEHIISNQVIIVRGETGSGKTTQIPQFILDYSASCKEKCRIICTQPRRISAISVAERVAVERGEKTGQTVGFHIRLESCVGPKTTLIYCTNGILLRTLMNGDSCLNSITHIIVDEIHERDRFSDFLLICLRECLVNFPHVRLILMSATIDVTTFRDYFNNAPIIYVPGRLHNVYNYYLDEILTMLQYESPAMKSMKTVTSYVPDNEFFTNFEPAESLPISDIHTEMDDCIDDCFISGTDDAFNLFLQFILNDHIPINYQHSKSGYTGLMAAAVQGNMNLCLQFLQFGANVKLRSSHENLSAADWAFAKQHIHVYELLKQYEAYSISDVPNTALYVEDEAKIKLDLYQKTVTDLNIDYDLLISLLYFIHSSNGPGSILVFLAGYDDIVTVRDKILTDGRFRIIPYEIFSLHGMMQISDQHKIFNPLHGKRKIILSTNIAETSITIDDVVFVIDCGKVKEKTYDALTGICSLQCCWISQSAAKQRAGRAGRTQNGFCFHLFSRNRFESMQMFTTPEMLRMPLHELCLQTKLLAPKEIRIAEFLCRALEPPSSMAVKNAIKHLQEIGALNEDESLTVLGQHLVDLPVEPRLAKMLIYAVIFRCIDPILTIVAFLSYRDPFVLPNAPHLRNIAAVLRKKFSANTFSDHMILLKVFQAWQDARLAAEERLFCTKNNLSAATMEMIVKIRSQLLAQLRAAGFVNTKPPGDIRELNEHSHNWAMIKGILTAGFFPNIAYIDKESLKIRTRKEKKVAINISSCLRSERGNNNSDNIQSLRNIPTNWLLYEELSRNNTHHNIRSVTCVTPMTIALFTNDSDAHPDSDDTDSDDEVSVSNQWIVFEGSPDILVMIAHLRNKINNLIGRKITFPHRQFSYHDTNLLHTVSNLLLKEDEIAGFQQPSGIGQRPKIMNCTNGANHEDSVKNRYKSHHVTPREQQMYSQVLSFKQVHPAYYNKYIPQMIFAPEDEESENSDSDGDLNINDQSEQMNNLLERFEEINVQNVVLHQLTQHDKLKYPENGKEFRNNDATPYLDEACAVEPIVGPLWMEQVSSPDWTVYCLIKTGTTKSIDVSIGKKVWVFPPYIEKKLKVTFEAGRNVLLIFTVQNSRAFQAIARLLKMPAIEDSNYSIQSSLEWISRADVTFSQVQEYFPEQYNDGDQLNHEFGVKLWQLFTNVVPPSIQQAEPVCVGSGRPITKRRF